MEHIGILTAIVLALSTFRLTRLITADQFPFGKVRLNSIGRPFIGELIICPFCMSVWVGTLLALGHTAFYDFWAWQVFIGATALSGVTCLIAVLAPRSFD